MRKNQNDSEENKPRTPLHQHLSKEEFERQAKEFALQEGFSVEDRDDTVGLHVVSNEEELENHQQQLREKRREWQEKLKGKTEEKNNCNAD